MEVPTGPAEAVRGERSDGGRGRLVRTLIGLGVAAVIGGVVGGLIVRATWEDGHVISVAADGGTLAVMRSDGESSDATIVGRARSPTSR